MAILLVEKKYIDVVKEGKGDEDGSGGGPGDSRKRKRLGQEEESPGKRQRRIKATTTSKPSARAKVTTSSRHRKENVPQGTAQSPITASICPQHSTAPAATPAIGPIPPSTTEVVAVPLLRPQLEERENEPTIDPESLRKLYHQVEGQEANKGKRGKREIEIGRALNDFINAGSRGLKCRREVLNVYFSNDKAGECSSFRLNPMASSWAIILTIRI